MLFTTVSIHYPHRISWCTFKTIHACEIIYIYNHYYTHTHTHIITHIRIVTSNHFSIWYLTTQTICGFIGVYWHIQDIWWMHGKQRFTYVGTRERKDTKKELNTKPYNILLLHQYNASI